ncbi:hypothetical protein HanXRQr2_Chr16g0775361 [Helianthus annuus]|uniref:Uncharacterized protein n=1 Tax=Helianthus annuus TaxID=4232 RepID=A0A9K3DWH0_HELAN|nr:hypothetical protein HanXRQr2_Chr16g0775361 [Helianthus annuus]KAJ0823440.1 hypothetical protein HanPSC8_Chr16g0743751 [Helianthus annuus]
MYDPKVVYLMRPTPVLAILLCGTTSRKMKPPVQATQAPQNILQALYSFLK